MSKEQRQRALRQVGKLGRRRSAAGKSAEEGYSHSQSGAANSENSGFVDGESGQQEHGEPYRQTHDEPRGGGTGLEGYGWYQEYVELSARFAWRLAAYIAWAASPVKGRAPATQQELAQALGLKTDRTIRQWKEKDPTIDQEIAQLQAAPLWRHRRDLYDALVRTAVAGDVPALKLALEMTGDYVPRMKQTVENHIKPGSYTADDLAAAERELGEWEGDRRNGRNRIDGAGDKVTR